MFDETAHLISESLVLGCLVFLLPGGILFEISPLLVFEFQLLPLLAKLDFEGVNFGSMGLLDAGEVEVSLIFTLVLHSLDFDYSSFLEIVDDVMESRHFQHQLLNLYPVFLVYEFERFSLRVCSK